MKRRNTLIQLGSFFVITVIITFNVSLNATFLNKYMPSLNYFINKAYADSEDCGVQSLEQFKAPDTGPICTCNGQVIAPQTCVTNVSSSCSPITCE